MSKHAELINALRVSVEHLVNTGYPNQNFGQYLRLVEITGAFSPKEITRWQETYKVAKDRQSAAPTTPPVTVTYRNWKGETRTRQIVPKSLRFGTTEYHPNPQYLLKALDPEDNTIKEFALEDCQFHHPKSQILPQEPLEQLDVQLVKTAHQETALKKDPAPSQYQPRAEDSNVLDHLREKTITTIMPLHQTIEADLTAALKAQDRKKLNLLRMLKASLTNAAIEKKTPTLPDKDVIDILRKGIKTRQESLESFEKGGRPELAETEKAEIEILKAYLPACLSPQEVQTLVKEAITEAQATSKKQMGAVMKIATAKAAGRVDGKSLSTEVQTQLSQLEQ